MDPAAPAAREDPAGRPALAAAMRWDAQGGWERAHRRAASVDTGESAWVRAHLPRREGDLADTDPWYRRAGPRVTAMPRRPGNGRSPPPGRRGGMPSASDAGAADFRLRPRHHPLAAERAGDPSRPWRAPGDGEAEPQRAPGRTAAGPAELGPGLRPAQPRIRGQWPGRRGAQDRVRRSWPARIPSRPPDGDWSHLPRAEKRPPTSCPGHWHAQGRLAEGALRARAAEAPGEKPCIFRMACRRMTPV